MKQSTKHDVYHCKCSFCKQERRTYQRIRTVIRIALGIKYHNPRYVRSERNLVK